MENNQIPAATTNTPLLIDAKLALSALAKVDDSYRSALELFYLGDLSYKEISSALGVPVGTVMSRLFRGKEQLRLALRDDFDATRLVPAVSLDAVESDTSVCDSNLITSSTPCA